MRRSARDDNLDQPCSPRRDNKAEVAPAWISTPSPGKAPIAVRLTPIRRRTAPLRAADITVEAPEDDDASALRTNCRAGGEPARRWRSPRAPDFHESARPTGSAS